jgi:lipopolysaccharide transport system ATP-binding protein
MNEVIIRAEGLSKLYHIGEKQEKYQTLRDTVTKTALRPARAVRSMFKRKGGNGNADSVKSIWALKDISFEVKRGEVLGVMGRNGAGKSTLLKILSRITEPTSGHADLNGRVGSLLEVGTGFHPELTGRENLYLNGAILGMKRAEIEKKFDSIIDFAEISKFVDTPVKHYSSGMYLRLAFAVAAHLNPEILLVDEVLAVGDAEFQKKCIGKMKDVAHSGRTILFVSHNMEALLSLCTSCIVVSGGQLAYQGLPEEAVRFYNNSSASSSAGFAPHVLYSNPDDATAKTRITRIELLDKEGKPKTAPYTWDDIRFRIHYNAAETVRNGSIILDIRDFKNQRLIVFDSGVRVPLRQGEHFVDCVVPRLPLPAGEFFLTGGLTRSTYQWLWQDTHLGVLNVLGTDIFKLGRPPAYSRMMFVADHDWSDSN